MKIAATPRDWTRPGGARLTTYRPEGEGYEVTRSVLARPGTVCEFTRGDAPLTAFAGRAEVEQVDADGRLLSTCPVPGEVTRIDYHPGMDRLLVHGPGHLAAVEPRSGFLAGQLDLTRGEQVAVTADGLTLHTGEQTLTLGPDLQAVATEVQGPDARGVLPLSHGVTAQLLKGTYSGTLTLQRAGEAKPFRTFGCVGHSSPALAPDGRLLFTTNEHLGSILSTKLIAYNPADDSVAETPLHAYDAELLPLRDGRVLVKDTSHGAERVFTVDASGKTKVFLQGLGEIVNVFDMVVSPDESQALVRVEKYDGDDAGTRVFRLNLEDNLFTRRARVVATEDATPFFLKDGSIALRSARGVEVLSGPHQGLRPDLAGLEVAGRWAGRRPVLTAPPAPSAPPSDFAAVQLDFRGREPALPPELGPQVQRMLELPQKSVQLHGDSRTCEVTLEASGIACGSQVQFPLPGAPSGLVALEGGTVVTRAGDVLAILEPYEAPGEVLRGPTLPLPVVSAPAGDIQVSEGALTIGDVTLERRA